MENNQDIETFGYTPGIGKMPLGYSRIWLRKQYFYNPRRIKFNIPNNWDQYIKNRNLINKLLNKTTCKKQSEETA